MAESLAQLESDLENLNKAIRAGIMMVQIGGQMTQFQSMKQMQTVASDLDRRIAQCKGITPQKPRVSSINMGRGV